MTQLRSFIGLVNYYGKFLPNMSTLLAPLYQLLQKNTKWTKIHKDTFQEIKRLLTSSQVLAHYDPSKELVLSCDASPYDLGAVLSVLSQVMDGGTEQPVAFASRSLVLAEKRLICSD